jgi:hypothetical protein
MAIPPKKEFASLAPSHRVFRRWRHADYWTGDVGLAGTGHYFHTPWSSHSGDRISMGQNVAINNSSMAARSFSENKIKKAN